MWYGLNNKAAKNQKYLINDQFQQKILSNTKNHFSQKLSESGL